MMMMMMMMMIHFVARADADALANMSSPSTTTSVRVAAVGASTTNRARRTTTTTKRMQLEERIDEVETTTTTTTTTRGRGRREVLRIAATCVGMGISSSIGRSGERVARASTPGETNPEDAMLREARARVGRAREDVANALKLLEPYLRDDDDDDDATSSSSRTLPLKELNALLATSPAIRALEEDAVVIDALTSKAAPLDDVEKRAWNSVNAEEWLTQSSTTTLPAKRPNDFLCAVFSCYNDPRAPPSTEMLLTLRLARDGVKMGLRNDARITAGGLTASLTDVLEKMDDYLSLVGG